MKYEEFIQNKINTKPDSGFNVDQKDLNSNLFDFQKHIVQKALKKGKYAIFANTGLGKTLMQLSWAHEVVKHTDQPVLILAPLAVSQQTIREGEKFGISITKYTDQDSKGIYISNYEQLDNIPCDIFSGIVLDESSILKNFTGKIKGKIIEAFQNTPYKLACTATPSPNDLNEIGNHSQFLDVMDANDMRMRWFVRDEGMNNYRLKGHADRVFFGWIGSWASVLRSPEDVGYNGDAYVLPKLNMYEYEIKTKDLDNGKLFNDMAVSATNFNSELRRSATERLNKAAELANNSKEPFIIWIKQNEEGKTLSKLIPDAVEVKGSDKPEVKEKNLIGFANGDFRVLITKSKIAGMGMNYQHCNNQIFASLDFSFESLYQSIRRSYRFGQKKEVNIHIITTDTMTNVIKKIRQKEDKFNQLMDKSSKYANDKEFNLKYSFSGKTVERPDYKVINSDCVKFMETIESDSIDFSVFSPPFSTLFTYSDNIHDMGNCVSDEEFFQQSQFMLRELYRIIKPGRLIAIHSKDLARYKNSSGYTGLYDFTGAYHKAVESVGFKYHSKITIWTDPVLEMQRTKTQRLLYKQLRKDSTYTGVGLPEYVTIFRKWEGNEKDWTPVTNKNTDNFPLDTWQQWASPVWMDIKRTDVLNNYKAATDPKDEKHIAPLQLSVIERCIAMWTNKGETVFTPYLGIGSEVYQAVKMHRKGIGSELKESYFDQAVKNINNAIAERSQATLF